MYEILFSYASSQSQWNKWQNKHNLFLPNMRKQTISCLLRRVLLNITYDMMMMYDSHHGFDWRYKNKLKRRVCTLHFTYIFWFQSLFLSKWYKLLSINTIHDTHTVNLKGMEMSWYDILFSHGNCNWVHCILLHPPTLFLTPFPSLKLQSWLFNQIALCNLFFLCNFF
jgi:hypothetical protein